MAYTVVENCPLTLKDWSNRASLKCSDSNTYRCVPDEDSRIAEVCTTPIWIKRGILSENITIIVSIQTWGYMYKSSREI